MTIDIEIPNYFDGEHREYGACLVCEVSLIKNTCGSGQGLIELGHVDATLFTMDQDGGESRQIEDVDWSEYIDECELLDLAMGVAV